MSFSMSIELFMGSFEEFPDRDNYIEMDLPRIRMNFPIYTRLENAIKEFREKVSQRGCQGAYYFAFSQDEQEFYLKGYPIKKK